MLMPTLSVSLIGLVVAALIMMTTPGAPGQTMLGGVLGAWLGFALGALAGSIVDVATGSGVFLAMAGHAAALVGAAVFAARGHHSVAFSRPIQS
ncbi:hypothetical protein GIY23_10830 [Allosaccharopolyspora coralli]|uniref:GlsB/YeaQ/YmgE family stress response membrane protein n=1 Tax=Allosaccharopolyspora coralli TaxID=2665642 RepID=A0A5Q3Q805_9PSEU|nr:hypothetical protein [Allosaccharopolyspora coralli]QGK69950.1 hypothetical protein GIY23_10830 [Allosaccharopolyspora coralli]